MPPRLEVALLANDDERGRDVPLWVVGLALEPALIVIFHERVLAYPYDSLESVFRHEVTHLALTARAGGRPLPRWLHEGVATCASLMVPAPWAQHAARQIVGDPSADIGVHLTLNCEHEVYRFGPVTHAPSLLSGEGGFPRTVDDLWEHADTEEVLRECRAQIERALAWGIDVTHLDSHMGALQYADPYFQVYRALAREFDLPIRMGSQATLAAFGGGHQRAQLDADGIVYPDFLIHGQRLKGEPVDVYWRRMLEGLQPGVTELYIHAALPGEEMRAITNSWEERAREYELFTSDASV